MDWTGFVMLISDSEESENNQLWGLKFKYIKAMLEHAKIELWSSYLHHQYQWILTLPCFVGFILYTYWCSMDHLNLHYFLYSIVPVLKYINLYCPEKLPLISQNETKIKTINIQIHFPSHLLYIVAVYNQTEEYKWKHINLLVSKSLLMEEFLWNSGIWSTAGH